jgi:hypothetical protein
VEPMTLADVLALLKWLEPVIPELLEAVRNNRPVEAVFAANRAAMDAGFSAARRKRAKPPKHEG